MTTRQWHLTEGRHLDGGPGTLVRERPATAPAEPAGAAGADGSAGRRLGVIGLALVLIAAMDSIRGLPTTATFGWSAIFFYTIAVGTAGLVLVVGIGAIGALFTFLLGFIPATHLSVQGTIAYVAVMAFGMRHHRHPVPAAPRPVPEKRRPAGPRPVHPARGWPGPVGRHDPGRPEQPGRSPGDRHLPGLDRALHAVAGLEDSC